MFVHVRRGSPGLLAVPAGGGGPQGETHGGHSTGRRGVGWGGDEGVCGSV